MRLSAVLLEHPVGTMPVTYALAALMCLDAARLRPSPVVALNRAIAIAQSKGPSGGSKRSAQLATAIASPRIPSTPRRLASSSFAAEGARQHESISKQRWL